MRQVLLRVTQHHPDPGGHAVYGESLQVLICWDMEVPLVSVACCQFLRRADHSSRGPPPSVACLSMIAKPAH